MSHAHKDRGRRAISGSTTLWTSCLDGSRFARHSLLLTKSGGATHVRARPGGLFGGGCDFTVFLQPN